MSVLIQHHRMEAGPPSSRRFASILFSRTEDFRFTTPMGRVSTRTISFLPEAMRAGRVISTGHEIALAEQTHLTLLAPAEGVVRVTAGGRTWEAGTGALLAVPPGERRTVVIAPRDRSYRAYLLMVPLAGLHALSEDRPLVPEGGAARLVPDGDQRLRATLTSLVERLLRCPGGQAAQREARAVPPLLLDLLQDCLGGGRDPSGARGLSEARVRQAEDLMRARADEALSIAALAHELGVGLRSLQIAFRQVRGIGPREALNRIRLENARARLRAADAGGAVTTIALDCGFTHLGRFAEAYRAAFGERPRETLSAARRA